MRTLFRRSAVLAGAVAVVLSSVMGAAAAPGASAARRAPAPGRAADPPYAYVANNAVGATTVRVVDTATNTLNPLPITAGSRPYGVAVSPDGSRVYVANYGGNSVSVIDTATNNAIGTPIAVGFGPQGIAVTPDGNRVYVANNDANTVSVINTTASPPTVTTITVGTGPNGVAVSPDGSRVYVTRDSTNAVSVISTADNSVTNVSLGTGQFPRGIAVSRDGTRLYVANATPGNVAVINTTTSPPTVMTPRISLPSGAFPQGVTLSPDGSRLYVANNGLNSVSVINTADNTVMTTLGGGTPALFNRPLFLAVTPDGSRVYVTNNGGSSLSMINTTTTPMTVTAPAVSGLSAPAGIAIAPSFVAPTAYAAYADNLRGGSLPSPWQNSTGVVFEGCNFFTPSRCPTTAAGDSIDAGALRLDNAMSQEMTVTDASVTIGSCTFNPWPDLDAKVPGHQSLILTQTGGTSPCPGIPERYNFDTSDTNTSPTMCTTSDGLIPVFHVTVDGKPLAYRDNDQILNVGGKDPGAAACGDHSEAHAWAPISMTTR